MSLAIEKMPVRATGHPTRFVGEDADQKLNIPVLFTSVALTLAALKEAAARAGMTPLPPRIRCPRR